MESEGPVSAKPVVTTGGLAIYSLGQGEPLLLMPYPHATVIEPMADGMLARLLVKLGRRVITFDPPGMFRSTRPARVDMPEMLECALEALEACQVGGRVDVVGHSMGGFCGLAFSLENPERLKRLVLINSVSGSVAVRRWSIHRHWPWWSANRWRVMVWGMWLMLGRGNLALHKRRDQLVVDASYVDKSRAPKFPLEEGDSDRPPPLRDRWPRIALGLDYCDRLGEIRAPTWVCVGQYDPQTPLPCSEELVRGIPDARLVIFENSGHSPFVEEEERFVQELGTFLATEEYV